MIETIVDNFGRDASHYALLGPKADECLTLLRERGMKLEEAELTLKHQAFKVVIVGEPNAGKITMLKRIQSYASGLKGHFPHKCPNIATNGIEVIKIKNVGSGENDGDKCSFDFFDFGGQETLYPTHQLFLTSNTLYILVVDLSLKEHKYLEY
jgi:GTPase SAR1 family protein